MAAIYTRPNLTRRNQEHKIYPYLLCNLDITRANQVWRIDLAYTRLNESWMYLVALMDWYSRVGVNWTQNQCLETAYVIKTVEDVLAPSRRLDIYNKQRPLFLSSSLQCITYSRKLALKLACTAKTGRILGGPLPLFA